MNSLDRAFIRAYARDIDIDSLTAAAANRSTQAAAAPVQPRRRSGKAATPAPTGEPLVQVSYADGTWYRIEQHGQPAGNVAAPHTRYENQVAPPEKPVAENTTNDDVDLMARFRPPMFRNVTPRSHEHAVAVKAEAIAAHTDALSPTSAENGKSPVAMPSLDYTLAPPSPPVAPQVPLTEFATSDTPPLVSPFAELAKQKPAAPSEPVASISAEELAEYAEQCQHLNSVLLELTNTDNLDSPDEAHVMLVDVPLELLENDSQRLHKRLLEEEDLRRREAMLANLMQQEVVVGDACEPQWLYGSEAIPGGITGEKEPSVTYEPSWNLVAVDAHESRIAATGIGATQVGFSLTDLVNVVLPKTTSTKGAIRPTWHAVTNDRIIADAKFDDWATVMLPEAPQPVEAPEAVLPAVASEPEPVAEEEVNEVAAEPIVEAVTEVESPETPEPETCVEEPIDVEPIEDEPIAEQPAAFEELIAEVEATSHNEATVEQQPADLSVPEPTTETETTAEPASPKHSRLRGKSIGLSGLK